MGPAPMAVSQAGEAGSKFSATVYVGSAGSGFKARSMMSRALSWSSVDEKRNRTVPTGPLRSKFEPVVTKSAWSIIVCTRLSMSGSILVVDLALDT